MRYLCSHHFFALAFLILISGCALPAGLGSHQSFIPESEISAVQLVRSGGTLIEQGRGVEAEIKLWRAYSLVPDAPNVLGYIVRAREVNNRFDIALELLDQILLNDPENLNLRAQRARILFKQGECQAARKVFLSLQDEVQELEDTTIKQTIVRDLASLEAECGDAQKGLCYLEESFYLKPSMLRLEQLVAKLISLGQLDRVELLIAATASQLGPASANLNLQRAIVALSRNEDQLAIQLFENVRTRELESSQRTKLELLELLLRLELYKENKGPELGQAKLRQLNELVDLIRSSTALAAQYPVEIWEKVDSVAIANDEESGFAGFIDLSQTLKNIQDLISPLSAE